MIVIQIIKVALPLVTLYLFIISSDLSNINYDLLDYIISNFIESAIEALLKDAPQKAVLQKVFYNEVFLQWSQSSTKAFISITDLINYRKHS